MAFAPATPVRDLGTWVSSFTCKNVVFAADVAKLATKVTVVAPVQLTPKQAVQLFVDALEAAGLEVIQRPDTFVVKRGPKMPASCPDIAAAPTAPSPTDDELARGITSVSPTEVHVTRGLLDKVGANPTAVTTGARLVPTVRDGKPVGFKLFAIRPGSLYARLGFVNGDLVTEINGHDLSTPDKALDALVATKGATRIELAVTRAGKPVTLVIAIEAAP